MKFINLIRLWITSAWDENTYIRATRFQQPSKRVKYPLCRTHKYAHQPRSAYTIAAYFYRPGRYHHSAHWIDTLRAPCEHSTQSLSLYHGRKKEKIPCMTLFLSSFPPLSLSLSGSYYRWAFAIINARIYPIAKLKSSFKLNVLIAIIRDYLCEN